MRLLPVVLGILIALAGIVWTLQGIGVLLGSFMSNDSTWIFIGGVTAAAGFVLVAFGLKSGSPSLKTN